MNNEKQLARLIDTRQIRFKNLSWPLKTATIIVWIWIAIFFLGFFNVLG